MLLLTFIVTSVNGRPFSMPSVTLLTSPVTITSASWIICFRFCETSCDACSGVNAVAARTKTPDVSACRFVAATSRVNARAGWARSFGPWVVGSIG